MDEARVVSVAAGVFHLGQRNGVGPAFLGIDLQDTSADLKDAASISNTL